MLAINALSYSMAWIVQTRTLNTLGILLVGSFALANAVLGMWLVWRHVNKAATRLQPNPLTMQSMHQQIENLVANKSPSSL